MSNYLVYASLSRKQQKLFNYLVGYNSKAEFIDWTYQKIAERFRMSLSWVKKTMLRFRRMNLLEKIETDGKKFLYKFKEWVICSFKEGSFFNQKRSEKTDEKGTEKEPKSNHVRKEGQSIENEPLDIKEIPPGIHISTTYVVHDHEKSFVQKGVTHELDTPCQKRLSKLSDQVKALAMEEATTYSGTIENASRFMNSCINRALAFAKGLFKPKVDPKPPDPYRDTTPKPKEAPIQSNAVSDELVESIRPYDGKTLSNGSRFFIGLFNIKLYAGVGYIEIPLNHPLKKQMIEQHILKFIKKE